MCAHLIFPVVRDLVGVEQVFETIHLSIYSCHMRCMFLPFPLKLQSVLLHKGQLPLPQLHHHIALCMDQEIVSIMCYMRSHDIIESYSNANLKVCAPGV